LNEVHINNVVGDSDISVWLGNTADPYDVHNNVNDAFLAALSPRQDVDGGSKDSMLFFNGGDPPSGPIISGNTLVISARADQSNDQFLEGKLEWSKCGNGNCPNINVSPNSLPNAMLGKNYDKDINASGGHGPYTFAVTSGALPPGLHLDPDSHIRGIPTATGSYTFTITATDSNGCMGSRQYTINVTCANINLDPGTVPNAKVGNAYSTMVHAGGGNAPYTFTVSSGSLPPGLMLTQNPPDHATISGTPTASGSYTFTIQATDASGCTGTKTYNMMVTN
jgi:hypothetical protein